METQFNILKNDPRGKLPILHFHVYIYIYISSIKFTLAPPTLLNKQPWVKNKSMGLPTTPWDPLALQGAIDQLPKLIEGNATWAFSNLGAAQLNGKRRGPPLKIKLLKRFNHPNPKSRRNLAKQKSGSTRGLFA